MEGESWKIVWQKRALADLTAILRYLGQYSPEAAAQVGETILAKVELLSRFPHLGKVFRKLGREDVRETPVSNYRLFYQIVTENRSLIILMLRHSARQEPTFAPEELNEIAPAYVTGARLMAIAAMALNRVIGRGNEIPWHLPEDFRWFKRTTMGGTLIMGRRTFESIGRPLPGRLTVVLSRSGFTHPEVQTAPSLDALDAMPLPEPRFICGGAEIYRQALPRCSDLYLTLVKREIPDGDAFFPPFEKEFELVEKLRETPEFDVLHYRRRPAADEIA
jgi:dihydrofolate reductase